MIIAIMPIFLVTSISFAHLYDATSNSDAILEAKQVFNRVKTLKIMAERKALYAKYDMASLNYVHRQHELVRDIDLSASDKYLIDRMGMAAEELVINQNIENPTCLDYASTGRVTEDECLVSKSNVRNYMGFDFNLTNEDNAVLIVLNKSNEIQVDQTGNIHIFTISDVDKTVRNHFKTEKKIEIIKQYVNGNYKNTELNDFAINELSILDKEKK